MWFRIEAGSVVGNLIPGRWRAALVRPDALELTEESSHPLLPRLEGDPARYAPLAEVRCFTSRRGILSSPEEASAVRVESVHSRKGVQVGFDFYEPREHLWISVFLDFQPAKREDVQ